MSGGRGRERVCWRLAPDLTALVDPGGFTVGADFSGIAPGVNGEEGDVEGGGEVQGAAVDADDGAGLAQQVDEFAESRAIGEVFDVRWEVWDRRSDANEADRVRGEGGGEFADLVGVQGFAGTAGVGVEDELVIGDG